MILTSTEKSQYLARNWNHARPGEHDGNDLDMLMFLDPQDFKDQERYGNKELRTHRKIT